MITIANLTSLLVRITWTVLIRTLFTWTTLHHRNDWVSQRLLRSLWCYDSVTTVSEGSKMLLSTPGWYTTCAPIFLQETWKSCFACLDVLDKQVTLRCLIHPRMSDTILHVSSSISRLKAARKLIQDHFQHYCYSKGLRWVPFGLP